MVSFALKTISITIIIALLVGAGAGYMVGNSPVSSLIEERDWLESEYDSLSLAFQDLEAELDEAEFNIIGLNRTILVFSERYADMIFIDMENQELIQQVIDLEAELDSAQELARDVLRNPSMLEVHDFITTDKTDENVITDEYVCRHIVIDFMKNAIEEGYLCYFVTIGFQDGAHAMVAFNTTDGGLIYVEPQSDDIVEPRVGHILDPDIFPEWGIIIDISLIP